MLVLTLVGYKTRVGSLCTLCLVFLASFHNIRIWELLKRPRSLLKRPHDMSKFVFLLHI